MTHAYENSDKYDKILEILKLVDSMSFEMQVDLLCRHGIPYLPSVLLHLILNMPDTEKSDLLDEVKDRMEKLNSADGESETEDRALTMADNAEKRNHQRQDCTILTDYVIKDRLHKDFVKDISEGGVFIETNRPVSADIGDKMVQNFSDMDEQILFKFNGEIVRIEKKGIGVKFTNLTPYQVDVIRNLIKKQK